MPEWAIWVQYVINGVVSGSIFALLGLGLTMVFGILWIVSLAHGEFYMLGAYVAFYLLTRFTSFPFLLSVLVAMLVVGLIGAVLGKLTINPIRDRHWSAPMLGTYSLSIIMLNVSLIAFGGSFKTIPSPYVATVFRWSYFALSAQKLAVILVAIAIFLAVRWVLMRTDFGRNVRATAQDRVGAAVVGISTSSVYTWTFAMGCAIAAAGGVLIGAVFNLEPYMGQPGLIKGWIAVILGGMGNPTGAMLGGLVIGVVESLSAGLIGSQWAEGVSFAIMVIILILRPQGLFGARRNTQ